MDRALLEPEGRIWRIEFGGVVRHVPSAKGLEYLSRLLCHPGERISALDLEGRAESGPRAKERARVNVTRAILSTLHRLTEVNPSLADHLKATVRTGGSCCYRPDPRVPIVWDSRRSRHGEDRKGERP
jgi:hypothetical protein